MVRTGLVRVVPVMQHERALEEEEREEPGRDERTPIKLPPDIARKIISGPADVDKLVDAFEKVYTEIYPVGARFPEGGYAVTDVYLPAVVRGGLKPVTYLTAVESAVLLGGATLGASLLAVHRPYLAEFRALRDVADVHAIAHLTGGGWEGNLPRALPDGTAARIGRDSWEVPAVFRFLARLGDLEEIEQFDTWNMGIGLVVAIAADARDAALAAVPGAVAL